MVILGHERTATNATKDCDRVKSSRTKMTKMTYSIGPPNIVCLCCRWIFIGRTPSVSYVWVVICSFLPFYVQDEICRGQMTLREMSKYVLSSYLLGILWEVGRSMSGFFIPKYLRVTQGFLTDSILSITILRFSRVYWFSLIHRTIWIIIPTTIYRTLIAVSVYHSIFSAGTLSVRYCCSGAAACNASNERRKLS